MTIEIHEIDKTNLDGCLTHTVGQPIACVLGYCSNMKALRDSLTVKPIIPHLFAVTQLSQNNMYWAHQSNRQAFVTQNVCKNGAGTETALL